MTPVIGNLLTNFSFLLAGTRRMAIGLSIAVAKHSDRVEVPLSPRANDRNIDVRPTPLYFCGASRRVINEPTRGRGPIDRCVILPSALFRRENYLTL